MQEGSFLSRYVSQGFHEYGGARGVKDGMNKFLLLLPLLSFLIIGVSAAHAEGIVFPSLSDKNLSDQSITYSFHENGYSVILQYDFIINNEFDVPEVTTMPQIDGTTVTIPVREQYIEAVLPPIIEPETEKSFAQDQEAIQALLDEKRALADTEFDEKTGPLTECWRGTEEFAAIQKKEAYETPEAFIEGIRHYEDNRRELLLNLKYDECRIQEAYKALGFITQYLSLPGVDEGSIPYQLDYTTDFEGTDKYDPLGPEAKEQAAIAEQYLKSFEFTGVNRGNPNLATEDKSAFCQKTPAEFRVDRLMCPVGVETLYIQETAGSQDPIKIHNDIQAFLCSDEAGYMKQYVVGNTPNWLEHCFEENEK